jgi:uncharacterized protein (TIGR03435 family)
MIRLLSARLILGLAVCSVPSWAQATFDVASVKLVTRPVPPHGVGLRISHGKLTIEAGELRQIIGLAYGIQRVLVQGCPDWCDEDMFDIEAKTDNVNATRDEIRPMLQALLAERFKLVARRASKEVQGFALTVGSKGPKLPIAKDETGPGNVFTPYGGGLRFGNMQIVGLVNYLANVLGQPVQDKTGLKDRYNFTLDFRPPETAGGAVPQAIDVPGMVLSAVDQQLGLKLQAGKVITDILVIERAEHPSEN